MRVKSTTLRCWVVASIAVIASLAIWCDPALAQCAMCKEALANSAEAAASAKQFNLGILVLLVPPVAMFAGIFVMVYRLGKAETHQ